MDTRKYTSIPINTHKYVDNLQFAQHLEELGVVPHPSTNGTCLHLRFFCFGPKPIQKSPGGSQEYPNPLEQIKLYQRDPN